MKLTVIGGNGFIGYHTVQAACAEGHTVQAVSLGPQKDLQIPTNCTESFFDVLEISETQLIEKLTGTEALVYAAGADDRITPLRPAYPFFYKHNVEAVEKTTICARKAGVKRIVICGSYFSYLNRIWPNWRLAKRHPYIRSRVEQAKTAIAAAENHTDVMILELPYIFGVMPGRAPLWKPLVGYVNSFMPLFYSRGGSNMVSVKTVANAILGAIANGKHGRYYPVGDKNTLWHELLNTILKVSGKKKRIIILPRWMLKTIISFVMAHLWITGKQSGLNHYWFMNIQTDYAYFNTETVNKLLKHKTESLEQAIEATIKASLE